LYGEVINVRDVITFEGTSVDEVQKHSRVGGMISRFCAQRGEAPEKPFSGKFVMRLPPELHRKAYIQAKLLDKSLNGLDYRVIKMTLNDR